MRIIESPEEMRVQVRGLLGRSVKVGLVPTMGYLHAGHASLIDGARAECGAVVVSIFVNPIQFGPNEDFERYPRDMESDAKLCAGHGADFIFAPTAAAMYPPGFQTKVVMGEIAAPLCGASRPGHFDGVATVVAKLLNIVRPDVAYFGEKDFQQLKVIKRMAADLDMGIEIRGMPIVREPDGLAMSSRNVYLSPDERERALSISRGIGKARRAALSGVTDAAALVEMAASEMLGAGMRIDYVELRDPETLAQVEMLDGPALMAVAAHVGRTRLIDNAILGE